MTLKLYIDGVLTGHSDTDFHTVGQSKTVSNRACSVAIQCTEAYMYSDGWTSFYDVKVKLNNGYRMTRRGVEIVETGTQSGNQPQGQWPDKGVHTYNDLELEKRPDIWHNISHGEVSTTYEARNFFSKEWVGEYTHDLYGTCNMSSGIEVYVHQYSHMLVRDPSTGVLLRGTGHSLPIRDD